MMHYKLHEVMLGKGHIDLPSLITNWYQLAKIHELSVANLNRVQELQRGNSILTEGGGQITPSQYAY